MPSSAPTESAGLAGQAVVTRIVSLDIFRGIVMALMIFVNDLASVHGLSKWTYHMPANVDAMTYVDMVFPAFLFIVGLALPLAVRQRLKRNSSLPSLWMHVLLRSLALLVLGLVLANAERGDAHRMGLDPNVWALLALVGGFLLWAVYSRTVSARVALVLRCAGALILVSLFAIYRRDTPTGAVGWIDFSYPEILGLIGITYFAVCLLYIPLRRYRWAPAACFIGLIVLNCVSEARWFPQHLSLYLWPFGNGAMAAIAMAGVVTSQIFLEDHGWSRPLERLRAALAFSVIAFAAGGALMPLGISKIRATPTWSLWSIAASCLLFSVLYWIADVRGWTAWAFLFRPAGSNTLLTYLLPDVFFYLTAWLGLEAVLGHWDAGPAGITRAVCFTIAMLLLSAALTKARVRLQL